MPDLRCRMVADCVVRQALAATLASGLLLAGAASAQVGVRPGDERPELPTFEAPEPGPELILPPIPQPRPSEQDRLGAQPILFVRGYRFEGNTAFTDAELELVAAPFAQREITTADLQALRDALTLHYVQAGYVTSGAVIPDQSPEDGVVEIRIVEGTLEMIEVEDPGWLRPSYVRSRLARAAGTPLNVIALEERIQLLQQDPHIARIDAELRPTGEPGKALLHVRAEETTPWSVVAESNNYQPPSIGAYGGHFALGWNDVTGFGDAISAAFDVTESLREYDVLYSLPLTRYDTALQLASQVTRSEVIEEPFDELDIESETESYAITLRQPLYTTLETTLEAFLTGEWRRSQNLLLGEGFPFVPGPDEDGVAKLALLRVGQDASWRDRTQVVALRSMFTIGLNVLGATRNSGSDVPDGTFVAWLGQLQWVRRFDSLWGIETLFRTDLQLSSQPLLGMEQFAVGGHATVRGYRENQVVRDQGVVSSIEVRIPLWRSIEGEPILQLAPFFDIGHSWNRKRPTNGPKTLPAVGIGMRWRVTRFLSAEIYWGQNLNDVLTSGDLQDYGVQFAVRTSFP
jgi:hemolysin activation/secretion protein